MTTTQSLSPATEKQIAFIVKLCQERVGEERNVIATRFAFAQQIGGVAKQEASAWIDTLLKCSKATSKHIIAASGFPAPPTSVLGSVLDTPAAKPEPELGYYSIDGNAWAYLEVKGKYGSVTKKLMKLVHSGWVGDNMKWIYKGGKYAAVQILEGQTKLDLAGAVALGKQYGCCVKCGRTLSDPKSVAAGIGPICQKAF